MGFESTPIKDLFVYIPRVFEDDRGYFYESYNKNIFEKANIGCEFVQHNQSKSSYGTIRGLHLQTGDHAQAKLVRVIQGEVLDVAVDLRPDSVTFGQHFSIILSEDNHKQLFIPRGFGHGFSVLSETAIFTYSCDNFYNKESEAGIIYSDADLNIDWRVPQDKINISEKDKLLTSFFDYKKEQGIA
jgi:dTDP-4-dehydrorhamnose 3,5-epimerase